MIRLIALDLDGTLLDPAGQITDETKAAIAQARQAGIKVVLSTGRSVQEAADFSAQAGCDNLSVCLGGAVLSDNATGAHLRRWDIPADVSRKALELCLNRDIELMIFAGEQIVLDPFSQQSLSKTFPYPVFHNAAVVSEDSHRLSGGARPSADQDPRRLEPAGLPPGGALTAPGRRTHLLQRSRL